MERIGTREEGFDVTALQANPASFEECALRPTAGLWLVFELELEDEEVCGLVHDHLMLLSLGVLPGRTSSVERPNKDCMDGYC